MHTGAQSPPFSLRERGRGREKEKWATSGCPSKGASDWPACVSKEQSNRLVNVKAREQATDQHVLAKSKQLTSMS
jgi:hypothetical protein